MNPFDHHKYRPAASVAIENRAWPNRVIEKAPRWVSVDLRDGNQALIEPMNMHKKQQMWGLLVNMGFKEIEVGFPSASQADYDFVRWLIDEAQIPEDVTVQVLMPAREDLIKRSFEALSGVQRAIMHVYNSVSPVQRERVFKLGREGITAIARHGAEWVKREAAKYPDTEWVFEYSPESFSSTEIDYAVEVCEAVLDVWQPGADQACIINLPGTVEISTPNLFADQVEYFSTHIKWRDHITLSVHTHNDRGGAVASSELALLAGAERVEGTLFGNGERTGNMDVITMAMNLYSQGIDPELDLSNSEEMMRIYSASTGLTVPPRHPWFGEMVYTAFSGSHQDAIRKCLHQQQQDEAWQVAYLPIDPRDIGRDYEAVIRVNSQSGKGGVAFLLERDYGIVLPRWLQVEMAQVVQRESDNSGGEIDSAGIYKLFEKHYIHDTSVMRSHCHQLQDYQLQRNGAAHIVDMHLKHGNETVTLNGSGEGGIAAFVDAWQRYSGQNVQVIHYDEHAIGRGTDAKAVAFVRMSVDGEHISGAAIDADSVTVSFKAIISAFNHLR
ncbi:2-isopropylmalate synthase [Mariprofundus sp. EBB-1]|uniref:2-isopropylmalate synthase n=1 Tax=Mariprofundus sp. EBB-1 TaxID=2650971 RepID=UPI000EF24CB1|nr:2-isopropylmalate synthase [Mariprofundus sp. EBB-1]RLL49767.1 2-isopropylmalate synthase [Mariprofundus sp. EBB-1]